MDDFYDKHKKCLVLDACETIDDFLHHATYKECGLVNQDKGTLRQLLYDMSKAIREEVK